MSYLKKSSALFVVMLTMQATASAAVWQVDELNYQLPGGLLDIVSQAQAGDTIKFNPDFIAYYIYGRETLVFDKPVHIDGSSLQYGINFQRLTSYFDSELVHIESGHSLHAMRLTNALFRDIRANTVIGVNDSDFICSACTFQRTFEENSSDSDGALIVSADSNVALLNTSFSSSFGEGSTAYYGTGNLYMVNTFATDNFVDYPTSGALFEGVGEDQLFYVRNSTFVNNIGHVFKMDPGAGSKLDIRHSIVVSNRMLTDDNEESYQIRANVDTGGYNILSDFSANSTVELKPSDTLNPDPLAVYADRDGDGRFTTFDLDGLPGQSIYRPLYKLNREGFAFNHGDPRFSPFELFDDYRRIPASFLIPMIQSLRNGDQFGTGYDRVSGGRLDIGSYEMPVD